MVDTEHDAVAAFAEHLLAQLGKHGFPERRVAFPIERLYESADAKGANFNRVLDLLAARGVAHEKTPERVIFSVVEEQRGEAADALAGFDPAMLAGMSKDELLAAAQAAMTQLGPEQLAAMRAMVEGMSPEQRDAMVEQARRLGLA